MDRRTSSTRGVLRTATRCLPILLRTLQVRRCRTISLTGRTHSEEMASERAGTPHIPRTAATERAMVATEGATAVATEADTEAALVMTVGILATVLSTTLRGEAAGATRTGRDSGSCRVTNF